MKFSHIFLLSLTSILSLNAVETRNTDKITPKVGDTCKVMSGPYKNSMATIIGIEILSKEAISKNDQLYDLLLGRLSRLRGEKKRTLFKSLSQILGKSDKISDLYDHLPVKIRNIPIYQITIQNVINNSNDFCYVEPEWVKKQ
ncbi:MAG: hypothetical protein WDZ41_02045 [Candidatus Babeliales bacterium]